MRQHLDGASRAAAEELDKRISNICIGFSQVLGEIDTKLYFTAAELAGVLIDY